MCQCPHLVLHSWSRCYPWAHALKSCRNRRHLHRKRHRGSVIHRQRHGNLRGPLERSRRRQFYRALPVLHCLFELQDDAVHHRRRDAAFPAAPAAAGARAPSAGAAAAAPVTTRAILTGKAGKAGKAAAAPVTTRCIPAGEAGKAGKACRVFAAPVTTRAIPAALASPEKAFVRP
jgi:hypothetical protein